LGAELNPAANELVPNANWIAHAETERWPMVSFGTSSDRIFTPEGNQAYYVTFAKGLPETQIAPYLSVSYSEFERRLIYPFGVNMGIHQNWDFLVMNDGRKTHLLLTHKTLSMNTSLMLIDLKRPRWGLSIGFGF
jgi:hypothetical protein